MPTRISWPGQHAKGEMGVDHYEVRGWPGWYQPIGGSHG
jgi:SRSO17 transposase